MIKLNKTLALSISALMLSACGGDNGNQVDPSSSSANPVSSAAQSSSRPSATLQRVEIQEGSAGLCEYNGIVESDHTGFAGSGYINGDNATGAQLRVSVAAVAEESATLNVRYANGGGARSADVLVNGVRQSGITFPSGDWLSWQSLESPISLAAGMNSITVRSTNIEGLANIDSVTVTGAALEPGDCSGANVSSSSTAQSQSSAASSTPPINQAGKQVEWLDRGLVAVSANGGVFLSWRILGTDPSDVAFNLYRNGTKLNGSPLTGATNYTDASGNSNASYEVRAILNGVEQGGKTVGVWGRQYHSFAISQPAGGRTPDGVNYSYTAGDASAADLDGDGEYEIVLKWDPTNAKDNAHDGYTGNVYLDGYEMDGTQLWRIDLGRNIRAGAHYTQFMVYDFDGDGKAELATKTGDGTRDAAGTVIGNANADHRNSGGRPLSGPEYFSIFEGSTGRLLTTIDYPNQRGNIRDWGDNYGNRSDRFLAGVAYLDGQRPSMIFSRGYYEKSMITALDWRNGQLTRRWTFTADGSQNQSYTGQGAHSLTIGDVDGDGRDEIVFGAATIDDNGRGLYSTQLGHGDALHMTDIDPNRPGLEVFMVHECPACYGDHGVEVHEGDTGRIMYSNDGGRTDVGRGVAIDVNPNFPGLEVFGSRGGTMTTTGERFNWVPGSNFAIWWDGDLLREILDGTVIDKWDYNSNRLSRMLSAHDLGAVKINGTKSNPSLSADLLGDWREEVIWPSSDNQRLMIFTTTIPTQHRLRTLMHDPQYRVAIAWQNVAYNQPPHPGFFLGANMPTPPNIPVYMVKAQ